MSYPIKQQQNICSWLVKFRQCDENYRIKINPSLSLHAEEVALIDTHKNELILNLPGLQGLASPLPSFYKYLAISKTSKADVFNQLANWFNHFYYMDYYQFTMKSCGLKAISTKVERQSGTLQLASSWELRSHIFQTLSENFSKEQIKLEELIPTWVRITPTYLGAKQRLGHNCCLGQRVLLTNVVLCIKIACRTPAQWQTAITSCQRLVEQIQPHLPRQCKLQLQLQLATQTQHAIKLGQNHHSLSCETLLGRCCHGVYIYRSKIK